MLIADDENGRNFKYVNRNFIVFIGKVRSIVNDRFLKYYCTLGQVRYQDFTKGELKVKICLNLTHGDLRAKPSVSGRYFLIVVWKKEQL